MTDVGNPWGQNSEDHAMDLAFGSGAWTKSNGFNASVFSAANSFVYLDGGGATSTAFNAFVGGNLSTITSFVNGGGHVMLNAARWDFTPPSLGTGLGTAISGDDSYSVASATGNLTASGLAAALDADGAGSSWTGGYFSHDIVTGVDTCYVLGTSGCVFGSKGVGLFVGGQTAPTFQSDGALQLRANELKLAAHGASLVSPVPEPATWAMMMIGLGGIGVSMRTQRRKGLAAAA